MTTTWSETLKQFQITLSNGDLTALGNGGAFNAVGLSTPSGVIGSGIKFYWTVTCNAGAPGVGVGNASTNLADAAFLGQDANSLANYNGAVFLNNTQVATVAGFGIGDVVCMACNGHNQIFFATNATPNVLSGGVDVSSLGDVFPAYNVKGAEQVTLNPGPTMAFAAPAGYSLFNPPAGSFVETLYFMRRKSRR